MKNLLNTIATFVLLSACNSSIDWDKERQHWGDFMPNQIKTAPIDYRQSPYYKHVVNHKGIEALTFMDSLEMKKLAYLSDSLLITGLIIMPQNPKQEKLPVIVFNRGGNQDMGRLTVGQMIEALAPLAQKGYLVIASHYRGNSSSQGQDEFGGDDVNDVINLIQGLSSLPYADTTRIGMLGISRGGMMSYQVLKDTKQLKAVAVIGGMSNLAENLNFHQGMEEVYQALVPNYQQNEYAALKARSAFYWAEKMHKVPMLVLHGTKDEHVNITEARQFINKLKTLNYPIQYQEFEDNHGLMDHHDEMYRLLLNHFDKNLR